MIMMIDNDDESVMIRYDDNDHHDNEGIAMYRALAVLR